jgi:hypothetical protein
MDDKDVPQQPTSDEDELARKARFVISFAISSTDADDEVVERD